MPLRVSGLRLPVGGDENELPERAMRRAGLDPAEVKAAVVARKSLDRRRGRPVFEYALDLHLVDEAAVRSRRGTREDAQVRFVDPVSLPEEPAGSEPLEHPPIVVGSGPAGLFAALHLARRGFPPLLLERGEPMNLRVRRIRRMNAEGVLDPESNYLFGEGGAGTFSDGKLTSRSKDPRSAWVLEEFRRLSGVAEVSFHYRPHLGSERIRVVVGRIRRELQRLGARILFGCRVEGLLLRSGRLAGVRTNQGEIPGEVVILGPGHSARSLVRELLRQGVPIERKPFQMGYRVEHPQGLIDRAVWRDLAGHPDLGIADYRFSVRMGSCSVFSFCMCPGGEIMAAVCDLDHMNTNGMSHTGRSTGFANSGVVTTIEPGAFPGAGPLAGMELQERHEARAAELCGHGLKVPAQRLLDFLEGRPSDDLPESSCRTGLAPVDLRAVAPPPVAEAIRGALPAIGRQIPGFVGKEALLVGPEARSSAPFRILRDPRTLESPAVPGLLPVGEGAGYAGGIVSAATDGLRAAQAVIARFAPRRPIEPSGLRQGEAKRMKG